MLARSSCLPVGPPFPAALHAAPPAGEIDPSAFPSSIVVAERDAEIVRAGAPARHCYQVLSGCVRTVRLLEDGRRQIAEFLLPGDLLGWGGGDTHEFGAEAVTHCRLRRVRLDAVEDRADHDPALARALRVHAAAQLRKAGERIVQLGRKAAAERIGDFLLEMNDRLPQAGAGVALPMGRADVADYLGLTTETVCRSLSALRRHRAIETDRASIRILDPGRLAAERCG